jgi:2-polyprenyl-6-methoxyphenol hydroxylase-like FAD-dependent oxidoreductase
VSDTDGVSERADVVIVGARCAGSPLATLLARRGLKVVVLDRSRFPSEVPSTHIIQPSGVQILDQLGALDRLWKAGAVPIEAYSLITDDARIETSDGTRHFGAPALCARRVMLDSVLVDVAVDAGADVRTGVKVSELIREDNRVVGVVCQDKEIRAPLVVGADGRHSTVATSVGSREYRLAPSGRMFAWGYFEGVDAEVRLRLARLGEDAFLTGQTDSGLFMVGIALSQEGTKEFLADRDRHYLKVLRSWPELADIMVRAKRVGPIRVVNNWYGYFREATGPGWALLGDAGHFKDPTPGQGISDSFRHGLRLAEAIERGLQDDSLDAKLAEWWAWRDEDGKEMHWFATDLGAAGTLPPLVAQVLRDVAASPQDTLNLFRVINHDLRPSEVFTNGRLAKAGRRVIRHRTREMPAMLREFRDVVKAESYRRRTTTDRPPGR